MEIRDDYGSGLNAEILDLYRSVGWTAYTDQPETLYRGLAGSLLVLTAHENGRLLGLVRVVGDGETIVYVQDLLVHPACQRRGVGTALLQAVYDRFAHVRQLVLITDDTPETAAFYRHAGLTELTQIGCKGWMKLT